MIREARKRIITVQMKDVVQNSFILGVATSIDAL